MFAVLWRLHCQKLSLVPDTQGLVLPLVQVQVLVQVLVLVGFQQVLRLQWLLCWHRQKIAHPMMLPLLEEPLYCQLVQILLEVLRRLLLRLPWFFVRSSHLVLTCWLFEMP
jgi:hypothetical protein